MRHRGQPRPTTTRRLAFADLHAADVAVRLRRDVRRAAPLPASRRRLERTLPSPVVQVRRRALAKLRPRVVVGTSSGSCGGRSSSGTCSRLTRIRVHVVERPRIASTSTSFGSRWAAASGWRAFQRSSPASASSLRAARAISRSGFVLRRRPVGDGCGRGRLGAPCRPRRACAASRAARGAAHPPACGSAAATARRPDPPPRGAPRARAGRPASPPTRRCPRSGSPRSAKSAGTVASVKSAGSTSASSSQASGIETRASGVGRTEYAEATVRSLAFWL